MIKLNIDVTKIPKERIMTKPEWKGKFINCILVTHPNERGDDGFISMDVTKEEREGGMKGTIIGNWRELKPKPPAGDEETRPVGRPTRPAPAPRTEEE